VLVEFPFPPIQAEPVRSEPCAVTPSL